MILLVVLYGYETWSLSLREQRKMRGISCLAETRLDSQEGHCTLE
jgi:hypothetical protein